ncbi:MAG: MtrB/PioB family outer membrane beta-barrel protein [Betaproteobacteria bacterium]|nr:MtrB/PioB family outer membrane beta-barrel protein [Betaproteobacteria bacterium]
MGPTASAANVNFLALSGGLPDVTFRQTRLSLFGKYALDKNSAVRVDLIHQNDRLNEWTWGYAGVPFTYADNTTITLNPNQRVTVLMGRYIYTFR